MRWSGLSFDSGYELSSSQTLTKFVTQLSLDREGDETLIWKYRKQEAHVTSLDLSSFPELSRGLSFEVCSAQHRGQGEKSMLVWRRAYYTRGQTPLPTSSLTVRFPEPLTLEPLFVLGRQRTPGSRLSPILRSAFCAHPTQSAQSRNVLALKKKYRKNTWKRCTF